MKRKTVFRSLIAALAGAAISCVFIFTRMDNAQTVNDVMRILSDGFLCGGLILALSGAMVWLVNQGTFSGLGYAFRSIFVSLHDQAYRETHKETYSDYVERKSEKKTPCLFLVIVGGAYLVVAVVFTVLFYSL